ncbi:MAG: restriction endonuclease subunit S [Porticoccaceae bacterium]|nr:restriction endonuclease subunit S [Porticoccaceae bacterium]
MTRVAHISDLHFGRHIPQVVEGLLDSLDDYDPDLVIISGDLTQRATSAQFRAAQGFVQALRWPRLVIPGNHDMPAINVLERMASPWRRWRAFFGEDLAPVRTVDGCIALGVNTARRAGLYLDWSRGRISDGQMQELQRQLSDADAECLRLVVTHHPFWLPEEYVHRHLIGRRDQAIEQLADAGVDMVLSGHIHLDFRQILKGVIISHAGTATSDRLLPGEPNSFNLIEGHRNELLLTQMRWRGSAFSPTGRTLFRRDQRGWQLAKDSVAPLAVEDL